MSLPAQGIFQDRGLVQFVKCPGRVESSRDGTMPAWTFVPLFANVVHWPGNAYIAHVKVITQKASSASSLLACLARLL